MMLPVDLIVANVMHRIASNIWHHEIAIRANRVTPQMIGEAVARDILLNVANQARIDLVIKAVAAAGGPADMDEISARFRAVQDYHVQPASGDSDG